MEGIFPPIDGIDTSTDGASTEEEDNEDDKDEDDEDDEDEDEDEDEATTNTMSTIMRLFSQPPARD